VKQKRDDVPKFEEKESARNQKAQRTGKVLEKMVSQSRLFPRFISILMSCDFTKTLSFLTFCAGLPIQGGNWG